MQDTPLVIAGKSFGNRLMIGTGKYRSAAEQMAALEASGAEIITVAIRRIQSVPEQQAMVDQIDWRKYTILPNTAGAKTAEDAVYIAKLARALTQSMEDHYQQPISGANWIKLEVQPDPVSLLPDPIGTLEAAVALIKLGFVVLPYIHADPILARRLEDAGCATVMPLGSPIGTGQGILTKEEIQIIIANAGVPVVVDAGLGVPSDASLAMEIGADACLVNSAIALAADPGAMGGAFRMGVAAGRTAYMAGRIPRRTAAAASSPEAGVPAAAGR